jgi:MazG family protein
MEVTAMPNPTDRLLEIMALLRDPERGCPWDVEQTFATIAPHTIEEAYEVADAIDRRDLGALKDELGDLLLQVVFHAQMASELGAFQFDDVVESIRDKLVRRHPHVFGDAKIDDAAAQTMAWEQQKAAERQAGTTISGTPVSPVSALDGITGALPALTRAWKLQKRASLVGFDWPDARSAFAKLTEETAELAAEIDAGAGQERLEDELGDLLFTCVNMARKLDVNPETALRRANAKFERRFREIETLLARDSERRPEDAGLDELEALWLRAKDSERSG